VAVGRAEQRSESHLKAVCYFYTQPVEESSTGDLCTSRLLKTSQPSSRRERNKLGKGNDAASGSVVAVFMHEVIANDAHVIRFEPGLVLSHAVQCREVLCKSYKHGCHSLQ
jgi:hypothetical protein